MKMKANEDIGWPGGKARRGEEVDGSIIPPNLRARWMIDRWRCDRCGAQASAESAVEHKVDSSGEICDGEVRHIGPVLQEI